MAKTSEARSEVFLMAFRSLSKEEKKDVLNRLLEEPQFREDVLDIVTIRQRSEEPSRPFQEYLLERRKRAQP